VKKKEKRGGESMDKKEVMLETIRYLISNPETQVAAIRQNIIRILTDRGEIGQITTGNQYMRTTREVRISDRNALLINEIIWDLIMERILTPGINADNLEWPWLHVNDKEKLKEKLSTLI
jgi:hypothetical protein